MKKIQEYNPGKDRIMSIVFDDLVTDVISSKKLNSMVTELFIRGRKRFNCFYYAIIF